MTITTIGPRERLLAAAADLFVREGVTAVGVDRLCEQAGVSKRSLYQHFGTKDALVATMLAVNGDRLSVSLPADDGGLSPRPRIERVFAQLAELADQPGFLGCPFVNLSSEFRSDRSHPAVAVARRHKQQLTDYFEGELWAAGATDPTGTAVGLTIVFDGASSYAVMHGTGIPDAARTAVRLLLDAALPPARPSRP